MKKILLLILTSLVLFAGCKKEDPDGMAVTKEYTCSCGAKYSVTCKNRRDSIFGGGPSTWIYKENPTSMWEVRNSAGEYISFYENGTQTQIKFSCVCGQETGIFDRADFQPQTATLHLP